MNSPSSIDGLLVQWGDRLFYPSNRQVRVATPRLTGAALHRRAHDVRRHIVATVVQRAPQVMVKVTGDGRGMGAIAAHLRYISKNGRLPFEDDQGVGREGKEALRDVADQSGAWAASASRRRAHGVKPSTSCCRCRQAPTRRSCAEQRASSARPRWRTIGT